jgi:2-polyprenyl-3-methyl-5-hydroxy-6-metoxy-1,4-benzoquinol methylase
MYEHPSCLPSEWCMNDQDVVSMLSRSRHSELPPQVQLESCPCLLDCQPDDELVLVGRDRIHNLPGEFHVVRCRTCGLMRTNPRPTLETIGFYYPAEYGPYRSTRVQPTESPPLWKRMVIQGFPLNTERLPSLKPGRMLEVGCASGAFLHSMARRGWEVEGLEASPSAAEAAQALGYPVHTGSLEYAPEPADSYNLVVGWMVLEHLHDPVTALRKLHRWTQTDGWLVLSVPNAGSLEFCIFKDAWYALHLPNHLYHYTPQTLKAVLAAGGWQTKRIFHQRVLGNLVASVGYILQDRGFQNRITKLLLAFPETGSLQYPVYPLALLLSLFEQTGRMTVWARKLHD